MLLLRAVAVAAVMALSTFALLSWLGGPALIVVAVVALAFVPWLRRPAPANAFAIAAPPPQPAATALAATLGACACPRCSGYVHWVSAFQTWWCPRCGRVRA